MTGDGRHRIFPSGLIAAGLGVALLIAAAAVGISSFLGEFRSPKGTADAPGEFVTEPLVAGEYVLMTRGTRSPDARDGAALELGVVAPASASYRGQQGNKWVEISGVRYTVVGTISSAEPGPHTLTLAGGQGLYPLVLHRDPIDAAQASLTTAGFIFIPAALLIFAGIGLGLRNGMRRAEVQADRVARDA